MAGVTERAFVAGPIASAGGRVITSPFQFYSSGEDHLRVTTVNSLTGVTVRLRGRFVDNTGLISPLEHDQIPNTDRTTKTSTIGLGVGAVLNVDVFASVATPAIGQTFVIVQLVRGLGAAGIVLGTILQGYITSTQHLAWPGSPIQNSIDGPGVVRLVSGTTPAAAAEIVETVPTGARWQLLCVFFQFNTSAVPANRQPVLELARPGLNIALLPPTVSQPASSLVFYNWVQGGGDIIGASGSFSVFGLPVDTPLLAGAFIETFTQAMQAGDQYQAPQLYVREWLEAA